MRFNTQFLPDPREFASLLSLSTTTPKFTTHMHTRMHPGGQEWLKASGKDLSQS